VDPWLSRHRLSRHWRTYGSPIPGIAGVPRIDRPIAMCGQERLHELDAQAFRAGDDVNADALGDRLAHLIGQADVEALSPKRQRLRAVGRRGDQH
jgi:hypothetical protein